MHTDKAKITLKASRSHSRRRKHPEIPKTDAQSVKAAFRTKNSLRNVASNTKLSPDSSGLHQRPENSCKLTIN